MSSLFDEMATSEGSPFVVSGKPGSLALEFKGKRYYGIRPQGPKITNPGDSLLAHVDGKSTEYIDALLTTFSLRHPMNSSTSTGHPTETLPLVLFTAEDECEMPSKQMEYKCMGSTCTVGRYEYYKQAVILLTRLVHARRSPTCVKRFRAHSPQPLERVSESWLLATYRTLVPFEPEISSSQPVEPPSVLGEEAQLCEGATEAEVRMWIAVFSSLPDSARKIYVHGVPSAEVALRKSASVSACVLGEQDVYVSSEFEGDIETRSFTYTDFVVACPPIGFSSVKLCRNRLFSKGIILSHIKSLLPVVPKSADMRIDHLALGDVYSVHTQAGQEHVNALRQMGHEVATSSPYSSFSPTHPDTRESIQIVESVIHAKYKTCLDLVTSKKFTPTLVRWDGSSKVQLQPGTIMIVAGKLSGAPRRVLYEEGGERAFGYLVMRSSWVKIRERNSLHHVNLSVAVT